MVMVIISLISTTRLLSSHYLLSVIACHLSVCSVGYVTLVNVEINITQRVHLLLQKTSKPQAFTVDYNASLSQQELGFLYFYYCCLIEKYK